MRAPLAAAYRRGRMKKLPTHLQDLSDPEGPIRPPSIGKLLEIDFSGQGWKRFEFLCLRLLEEEVKVTDWASLYGTQGQKQDGIDLFAELPDETFAVVQCRHLARLHPKGLESAVNDFLQGKWTADTSRFIFATTARAESTGVVKTTKTLRNRLKLRGISLEVWGRRELSNRLKTRPDLVGEFFGQAWVDAFCLTASPESTRQQFLGLAESAAAAPVILDTAGAAVAVQKAVRKLKDEAPDQVTLVQDFVVDDHKLGAQRAAALAVQPPERYQVASWQVWSVIAHVTAAGGDWKTSSAAWREVALRRDEPTRALVNAAIAADIAGDFQSHAELLAKARKADPEHPKLLLEEIKDYVNPAEVLAQLRDFESDAPGETALAAGHRAIAHLMLDQLPEAEREIDIARRIDPETVQVRILEINLSVHRERKAMLGDAFVDDAALDKAIGDALILRDELIPEARFTESNRLLMMAVDAATMRYERDRAAGLLEKALPAELTRPADRLALVEAAIRGGQWKVARRLVDGAPDTAEFRRLGASVRLALNPRDSEPLAELEALVAEGGEEAEKAGFALLLHSAMRQSPWSPQAEEMLLSEHKNMVIELKALRLSNSNDYREAKKLLRRHLPAHWARQSLFDLAVLRRDQEEAEKHVPDLLAANPGYAGRVSCARILLNKSDLNGAETHARMVVESHAASHTRAEAAWILVQALGADERWDAAREVLEAWTEANPSDPRIGWWRARVGNRVRQQGS